MTIIKFKIGFTVKTVAALLRKTTLQTEKQEKSDPGIGFFLTLHAQKHRNTKLYVGIHLQYLKNYLMQATRNFESNRLRFEIARLMSLWG